MTKVFKIIIVAIALTSTAYSQQVRSSYFSVEQLGNNKNNLIRAFLPGNMLVVSSFSTGDRITRFAFIKKNSNVVKYIELPYNYKVNDFVILDSCIYFCGQTGFGNRGYIGMSVISTSLQGVSSYCLLTIDSATTFTKLIAYEGTTEFTKGITAIGIPTNTDYTSCIVDVNNYESPGLGWKYWYGHVADEEMTDICDASSEFIATVGKTKTSNSGNGISIYSPTLYLRKYRKGSVLEDIMSNTIYKYSNYMHPYEDGGFFVEKVDGYNIAVVGASSEGRMSVYYPITISKININTLVMNNTQRITFDSTYFRSLLELEYFPATNKLGILANKSNIGELMFADMTKTSAYTSSRLWRDDNGFISITASNNGNFGILCIPRNVMTENLFVLFENIGIFKDSQCSSDANISVSANSVNVVPTTKNDIIRSIKREANWIYSSTNLYETTIDIHCANYYK